MTVSTGLNDADTAAFFAKVAGTRRIELDLTAVSSGTQTISIPSGADAFSVGWSNVSMDGTAEVNMNLGNIGGPVITGYEGSYIAGGSVTAETTGLLLGGYAATRASFGRAEFTRVTGNLWAYNYMVHRSGVLAFVMGQGSIDLTTELTTVNFVGATGVFNAGDACAFIYL